MVVEVEEKVERSKQLSSSLSFLPTKPNMKAFWSMLFLINNVFHVCKYHHRTHSTTKGFRLSSSADESNYTLNLCNPNSSFFLRKNKKWDKYIKSHDITWHSFVSFFYNFVCFFYKVPWLNLFLPKFLLKFYVTNINIFQSLLKPNVIFTFKCVRWLKSITVYTSEKRVRVSLGTLCEWLDLF